MFANNSGNNNTALGYNALGYNSNAWGNTAVGYQAAFANTTGQGLVAIGDSALYNSLTASGNTALGYRAGTVITTGSNNTFIGYLSNAASNTLTNATAIGANASVGASNSLILGNNANVGIGTSTPSYKLDVVGRSRFQTGSGSAGFWLTNNANSADRIFHGMVDDNTVGMYSNATSSWGFAYKLTNGNIGMGLTVPEANLHLFGSGTSGYTPTGTTVMPNPGAGPELAFSRGGAYKPTASVQLIDYNGYSGGLAFNVHKGTANSAGGTFADNWPSEVNQAMTIVNNGNIGIGTSDPQYKLDIDADTGNPLRLQGLQAGLTSDSIVSSNGGVLRRLSIAQVAWSTTGNGGTNPSSNFVGTTDAQDLVLKTNNTEVVRVSSAGNMLIGALTPGETTGLALVNQSASDQKDDITTTTYNSTTTPSFVVFKARGTAAAPTSLTNSETLGGFNVNGHKGTGFTPLTAMLTVTSSDYTTAFGGELSFRTARSGAITECMRITSTARVGIGVAAPSHILHINGQGRATLSSWATTSDRRLKDIDSPYEYGLKELLNINTYRFHYKKDNPLNLPTDKAFQGVMAQDLQKVIPEAVTKQADGYLTVSTDPVFWTMLNAIKDLKKENDDLKAELERAKTELTQQSKNTEGVLLRLEKLEAALTTRPVSEKQVKTDRK